MHMGVRLLKQTRIFPGTLDTKTPMTISWLQLSGDTKTSVKFLNYIHIYFFYFCHLLLRLPTLCDGVPNVDRVGNIVGVVDGVLDNNFLDAKSISNTLYSFWLIKNFRIPYLLLLLLQLILSFLVDQMASRIYRHVFSKIVLIQML